MRPARLQRLDDRFHFGRTQQADPNLPFRTDEGGPRITLTVHRAGGSRRGLARSLELPSCPSAWIRPRCERFVTLFGRPLVQGLRIARPAGLGVDERVTHRRRDGADDLPLLGVAGDFRSRDDGVELAPESSRQERTPIRAALAERTHRGPGGLRDIGGGQPVVASQHQTRMFALKNAVLFAIAHGLVRWAAEVEQ